MFTKKDREMLYSGKEVSEILLSHIRSSIDDHLKRKCDKLSERATKAESENIELQTKVDLYEKYIKSITNKNTSIIGEVFMFDGELYRLINRTINEEGGFPKTMSANFECVTGITKNFKDGNKHE